MPCAKLQVGGFVPFTTVDFPGKLSAVVFCQGCPWRCSYCHNPHLQSFHRGCVAWQGVLDQIRERRGFLDAVVFSGGEPTSQQALPHAIEQVAALGYLVGLHTAGMHPERLGAVLPSVDWVGFDVKAPLDERYDRLTGRSGSAHAVAQSLLMLLESGVDYQIRTTLDTDQLDESACSDVARCLRTIGANPTHWQACRPVRSQVPSSSPTSSGIEESSRSGPDPAE